MANENQVHLRNTSGSGLEIASLGITMTKDQVTADTYPLEDLQGNEIKKYQQLRFLQFLTPEQAAKILNPPPAEPPSLEDTVLASVEQPKAVLEALDNLEKAASVVRQLLTGKKVVTAPKTKAASAIPQSETEAANGSHPKGGNEPPNADNDDDHIPDMPPPGMRPMNDPVKKLFGSEPYSQPMNDEAKISFISDCWDIGMLREMAIFQPVGKIKDLAKKKLRQAKAAAARS